jgi:hypothetical protein
MIIDMTEKEIIRLYLLEGILKNLENTGKDFNDICVSSPKFGVIKYEDMYDAIMNGKILPFLKDDYVDLFQKEMEAKGISMPEESEHTLEELRAQYDVLDKFLREREERDKTNED